MSRVYVEKPEGWIEDRVVAEEVAYASKDERFQAIGLRVLCQELHEARQRGGSDEVAGVAGILSEIDRSFPGTLLLYTAEFAGPEVSPGFGEYHGAEIVGSRMAQKASRLEEIQEALSTQPPSKDFWQDHSDLLVEYSGQSTAHDVLGLLASQEEVMSALDRLQGYNDRREKALAKASGIQKFLMIADYLNEALDEMDSLGDFDAFIAEANAELDNPSTSLVDVERLWRNAVELYVDFFQGGAARLHSTYKSIVSGEAASYKSPRN